MSQFRPLTAKRVTPRRRGLSVIGVILIAAGLIGLLVTYSVLPGWVPRFWPLIIILLGGLGLFRRPAFVSDIDALIPGLAGAADRPRRRFSLALIILGAFLLLFTSRLVDDRLAGPIVIVAIGIAILWRRYR